jgi:hypothetical protein
MARLGSRPKQVKGHVTKIPVTTFNKYSLYQQYLYSRKVPVTQKRIIEAIKI